MTRTGQKALFGSVFGALLAGALASALAASPLTAYASGKSHAGGWGRGSLGGGGVSVGIGVVGRLHPPTSSPPTTVAPGAPNTTTTTSGAGSAHWVSTPCPSCVSSGIVCLPDGQLGGIAPGSPLPPGDAAPYVTYLEGPLGGTSAQYTCPSPATATTVPPPPPTGAQVWESAPLPAAEIEFSPSTYGIAQLPTWFWLGNDAGAQAVTLPPIYLDGYSVVLSVHPVAYYWSFGDGATAQSSSNGGPGGAAGAAATHIYTQKGTYDVGVRVVWAGTYTFSGYGTTETFPLGPVEQPEQTVPFVVQEVKALLVRG